MKPDLTVADVPDRSPGAQRILTDVICPACGCLCDDLRVTVEDDRILEIESACLIGERWFKDESTRALGPIAAIDGVPATPEEALDRAAAILRAARCPVLFGLTRTVLETSRAALALADLLGMRVVLNRSADECRRVAAFQNQGRVTATLGEVKTRADTLVFWRCDPVRTHPRHFERYSADTRGRFAPEGRNGRLVIVVDRERTATADAADFFVQIPEGDDFAVFKALRLLLSGRSTGLADFGMDVETLFQLKRQAASRRYWAVLAAGDGDGVRRSSATWEELTKLVREANDVARVVLLGLGRAGNLAGAEAIQTWQSGFLGGVEFSRAGPRPLDGRGTLADVLESGEIDAVLGVADGWPEGLSENALRHLNTIPRIMIGPPAIFEGAKAPTVEFAASTPAIDASGTITRVDGVCLPVRALFPERLPADRYWLKQLTGRLRDGMVRR